MRNSKPRSGRLPGEAKLEPPLAIPAGDGRDLTEMANARRFAEEHQKVLRYRASDRNWYVWDERVWQSDKEGSVLRLAQQTVERLWDAVSELPTGDLHTQGRRHARHSSSAAGLRAMISLAAADPRVIAPDDGFDAAPHLLNVANGTIDLRTGQLRPHRSSDLLTRLIEVEYDERATCPRFLQFLDEVLKEDEELQAFLQRAVGYSLTGETREQVLFFLVGHGGNGKTTLLEVLRALLAPYAAAADMATFLPSRSDRIREDLFALKSARFVTAVEAGEQTLDEVLLKRISGGDFLRARTLYRKSQEFRPEFKLWFAMNQLPAIRGTDDGIWRRVRVLPFEARIAKVDHHLLEKLQAELPGILTWAVCGSRDFYEHGLQSPARVRETVHTYRLENDPVAAFLQDCCVREPLAKTVAGELYQAYVAWCFETVRPVLSTTAFGRALNGHGLYGRKSGSVCWRLGVRPTADPRDELEVDPWANPAAQRKSIASEPCMR